MNERLSLTKKMNNLIEELTIFIEEENVESIHIIVNKNGSESYVTRNIKNEFEN